MKNKKLNINIIGIIKLYKIRILNNKILISQIQNQEF